MFNRKQDSFIQLNIERACEKELLSLRLRPRTEN